MSYRVYYIDGPCRGKLHTEPGNFNAGDRLACGGAVYVYSAALTSEPTPGTPAGGSSLGSVGLKAFVVYHGKYDGQGVSIQGETDVFKSWSRLHHALNRGVGRQSQRVSDAGRRIRRAVR